MFTNCQTLEDAKKLYHELLKENHPDLGGDEETTKKIINDFESFVNNFTQTVFDGEFSGSFGLILNKIINFENMEIQIIGTWIYCFNSYQYKDNLKALGFWFSRKHKAWIYSGDKKKAYRSRLTTDDIRHIHGCHEIKTSGYKKIA